MSQPKISKALTDSYYNDLCFNDVHEIHLPTLVFNNVPINFSMRRYWVFQEKLSRPVPSNEDEFNVIVERFDFQDTNIINRVIIIGKLAWNKINYDIQCNGCDTRNHVIYERPGIIGLVLPGNFVNFYDEYEEFISDSRNDKEREKIDDFYKYVNRHQCGENLLHKFINEFADNLPNLYFCSFTNKLKNKNNPDDMSIEHITSWFKALNPDYHSECCVCQEESRYRTSCNHCLCLGCHIKLEQIAEKNDDESVDSEEWFNLKCPMCRQEYQNLEFKDNN
jgi:hypothetical protein